MVGMLAAMEIELENIINQMDNVKLMFIADKKFYQGQINGTDIVIVLSGIGKVNAAITTTLMLQNFDLEQVISVGIAGGIGAKTMDIVISNKTVQYDFDLTAFGNELGRLDERSSPYFECDENFVQTIQLLAQKHGNVKVGVGVTGDAFMTDGNKANELQEKFGALYCDMESAAIAQVCEKFDKKFISIRTISDEVGQSNISDYENFKKSAAKLVSHIIKEYCVEMSKN